MRQDRFIETRGRGTSGFAILRLLSSFPIAFFTGALATDIAYWNSADIFWADASAWLLAVGIAVGGLAALVGIILLIASRAARAYRPLAPTVIGSVVVLGLALLNNLVHSRDGWTSVVPYGLVLSALTVLCIVITGWFAAGLRDRRLVVAPEYAPDYVEARP